MPESSIATRNQGEGAEDLTRLEYQEGWCDGRFDTHPEPSEFQGDAEDTSYLRGYRDGLRAREMLYTGLISPEKTFG